MIRVGAGELDLERFEHLVDAARVGEPAVAAQQLREALALWRGPPLADLDGVEFADGERARLEEHRLGALGERIDADLQLGRHAALVPELELLVREHPLRERLRGQLMLALYRCGRQADALESYREGRRLLDEELGLQPSEELRRLERSILEQDPALALSGPNGQRRAAPVPTGTVTFLFTDIEGSTRLVQELDEGYGQLLEQHHALLRAAFEKHGGQEVDSQGDAFFFAFRRARDGVRAAVEAQKALAAADWPRGVSVRIRVGIHTGEPGFAESGYHGLDVVRAARISGCRPRRPDPHLLGDARPRRHRGRRRRLPRPGRAPPQGHRAGAAHLPGARTRHRGGLPAAANDGRGEGDGDRRARGGARGRSGSRRRRRGAPSAHSPALTSRGGGRSAPARRRRRRHRARPHGGRLGGGQGGAQLRRGSRSGHRPPAGRRPGRKAPGRGRGGRGRHLGGERGRSDDLTRRCEDEEGIQPDRRGRGCQRHRRRVRVGLGCGRKRRDDHADRSQTERGACDDPAGGAGRARAEPRLLGRRRSRKRVGHARQQPRPNRPPYRRAHGDLPDSAAGIGCRRRGRGVGGDPGRTSPAPRSPHRNVHREPNPARARARDRGRPWGGVD